MGLKNIEKAQVLRLGDEVEYQPGQIVSKTLAQNRALSMTLFAFEQDEEISTHASGGDAFVTCLDGESVVNSDVTIKLHDKKLNFFGPQGCDPNYGAGPR